MTSRNAGSVRTRTVGTALYNMCVQASNIIAANVGIFCNYVYFLIESNVLGNGLSSLKTIHIVSFSYSFDCHFCYVRLPLHFFLSHSKHPVAYLLAIFLIHSIQKQNLPNPSRNQLYRANPALRSTAPPTHHTTTRMFPPFPISKSPPVSSTILIKLHLFNFTPPPHTPLTHHSGNKVLIAITAFNIALILTSKSYYIWRNKVRERKWKKMSPAEKKDYINTFADEKTGRRGGMETVNGARGGNKRSDFRFVH